MPPHLYCPSYGTRPASATLKLRHYRSSAYLPRRLQPRRTRDRSPGSEIERFARHTQFRKLTDSLMPRDTERMKLISVRKNGQVTLPAEIRRRARLEPGDVLEADVVDEGIVLRPKKLVDASQAYFWTKRWQRGEREAQRDIDRGRVKRFDSVEEAIAALKK